MNDDRHTGAARRSVETRGKKRGPSRACGDWYRQAVEAAPDPILLLAPDGGVREWNPAAVRTIAPAETLAASHFEELFERPGEPPLAEFVARALGGEVVTGLELICHCRDDRERRMQVDLYPVWSPDGQRVTGCIVSSTDVTERAQHEEELRAAKETAEEAARLKSNILSNLSHEIRTPLTAILGFAELLVEEVAPPQREFAELIRTSSKRLMGTLVSVLELARLESGDMRLRREPVDLGAEAADVVRMLRSAAERKGLAVDVVCPPWPVRVRLDPLALNRILANLVTNAIKFTFEGEVRVEVGLEGTHPFVRVSDTGVGVSEAFMPYLFDEFKQESSGYGRRHEGTGLGLAITRRLADVMEARIEVESEKGRGSTFTVYFPSDSLL